MKGPGRISLRGFASAPRHPRLIPLSLDVEVLEYIDPHAVYLRFSCSILTASIVPYYLGISDYSLDRRRVAANSYIKYVVFRTLADLTVF
jgi:hypothetical protein